MRICKPSLSSVHFMMILMCHHSNITECWETTTVILSTSPKHCHLPWTCHIFLTKETKPSFETQILHRPAQTWCNQWYKQKHWPLIVLCFRNSEKVKGKSSKSSGLPKSTRMQLGCQNSLIGRVDVHHLSHNLSDEDAIMESLNIRDIGLSRVKRLCKFACKKVYYRSMATNRSWKRDTLRPSAVLATSSQVAGSWRRVSFQCFLYSLTDNPAFKAIKSSASSMWSLTSCQ